MTAPRIDTVRRDTNRAIHQLAEALEHLTDLHDLAYDRAHAATAQRVAGGTTDYALDTHGDPHARNAYTHLAQALQAIADATQRALTTARTHFDHGTIDQRRDTTADATTHEIIAAIANRARHTPIETQPLPTAARRALDAHRLQTDLDTLRSAVRKAGRHPNRNRLTPLEDTAWQTAHGTPTRRRKKTR